jgi:hypothetical protein
MRSFLILAGLVVAVVAVGVQLRATLKASEARAATAAEWSGDAALFVTAGLTNRTLVIDMPDQLDVVGCDALIDRTVADQRIVNQIHAAKTIPFDVMGGTTRHLLSLFDHIRLQRNDAIHPMNSVVSANSVRFSLYAFPMAFQRVEALRQWCDANPNSL